MFPKANVPVERLIDFVPDIKPRLYSIASDPDTTGQVCNLCIVADDWNTPSGKYQHGVCTEYLMQLGDSWTEDHKPQVAAKVNPAAVHMPEDPMTPIVLTGLGTGLAPIRAIVQQRMTVRASGQEVGPMCLIFGARYQAQDFLYEDEINDWLESGLLTELVTAWSRDQEKKVYVQHRIEERHDIMSKYLVEGNGYFYLCGPAGNMPPAVRQSVINSIAASASSLDEAGAEEYVTNMQITGRYNVEAW